MIGKVQSNRLFKDSCFIALIYNRAGFLNLNYAKKINKYFLLLMFYSLMIVFNYGCVTCKYFLSTENGVIYSTDTTEIKFVLINITNSDKSRSNLFFKTSLDTPVKQIYVPVDSLKEKYIEIQLFPVFYKDGRYYQVWYKYLYIRPKDWKKETIQFHNSYRF